MLTYVAIELVTIYYGEIFVNAEENPQSKQGRAVKRDQAFHDTQSRLFQVSAIFSNFMIIHFICT